MLLRQRRSANWCDVARMVILTSIVSEMAVLVVEGGDPYVYIDWKVSYLSASPLGVKQQVILIWSIFFGVLKIEIRFSLCFSFFLL